MKTLSELTDYYYKELYPSIDELEKTRQEIASRLKLYGGMGLALFGLVAIWCTKTFGLLHPMSIAIAIGFIAVGTIIYRSMTQNYAKDFKEKVITPLINAIDSNLLYNPDLMISQTLFERSQLFNHSIDRYRGNDYVKGSIDGVPIEFSDVHAEYQTRDSKGRTQWHTLFRGLFLVAEFNKHFKSRTVLLPDLAEKTFGNLIGGWLQSLNISRDKVIQLDDPEFEKKFVVYGNDPIEARYILSHSMMNRIVEFQKKISYPLFISFVYNHIHVGIGAGKDLFEPAVFTSLLDYKQAMEYINTLRYTIGLVEELKLNEKLWSKE
ncbi:MAG: DUF3137 domain-containing protein [Sulfuricurvum sp.]|uniref:DUF3137 domain-containing protein n=1 Tax=Sulfuricurvum sp. TaxID=2025608 RepID=UPI0026306352|nr:DUF3137 domain-containing protein [Sulfuricurvum sp.]MDD2829319.1 DUF3137 domain-containing protein [Sulfuricurvum sp.]MDD4948636.1 DUF3137 domain-containing protein [Sulfuricurvum sp.]